MIAVSRVYLLNFLIMCVIVMPQRQFMFFNDVSPKSVYKILGRIVVLFFFFFYHYQSQENNCNW